VTSVLRAAVTSLLAVLVALVVVLAGLLQSDAYRDNVSKARAVVEQTRERAKTLAEDPTATTDRLRADFEAGLDLLLQSTGGDRAPLPEGAALQQLIREALADGQLTAGELRQIQAAADVYGKARRNQLDELRP
jgi:hypothetical protein